MSGVCQMKEEHLHGDCRWQESNPGSSSQQFNRLRALSSLLITRSLWLQHLLPSRTCSFGSTSVSMIRVYRVCVSCVCACVCVCLWTEWHYSKCDARLAAYVDVASFECDNLSKSSLASLTAAWKDCNDFASQLRPLLKQINDYTMLTVKRR